MAYVTEQGQIHQSLAEVPEGANFFTVHNHEVLPGAICAIGEAAKAIGDACFARREFSVFPR